MKKIFLTLIFLLGLNISHSQIVKTSFDNKFQNSKFNKVFIKTYVEINFYKNYIVVDNIKSTYDSNELVKKYFTYNNERYFFLTICLDYNTFYKCFFKYDTLELIYLSEFHKDKVIVYTNLDNNTKEFFDKKIKL